MTFRRTFRQWIASSRPRREDTRPYSVALLVVAVLLAAWITVPTPAMSTGISSVDDQVAVTSVEPVATEANETNEATITVKVGGDRGPDGQVQGLPGVVLGLYGGGNAGPAERWDPQWSWTTCTSDAEGDCVFTIPVSTSTEGEPSADSVPQDTRFWVRQEGVPEGWYANPQLRVADQDGRGSQQWQYHFRTDSQVSEDGHHLRAGQNYVSTDALNPDFRTDPLRGFMRNYPNERGGGVGSESHYGRTTGVWQQSRENPTVARCGMSIALVLDTSGSMGSSGMAQAREAMDSYLDGLVGTPSQVALFSFSTSSPGASAANHPDPRPVSTQDEADHVKTLYADWQHQGATNYDDAFRKVAESAHQYDMVVFITDGAPNVVGVAEEVAGQPSNRSILRHMEAAIFSANAVKARGSRIVVLGVGEGIQGPAHALNLRAISGPEEGRDYFQGADWAQVTQELTDLAREGCGDREASAQVSTSVEVLQGQGPSPSGSVGVAGNVLEYAVTFDNSEAAVDASVDHYDNLASLLEYASWVEVTSAGDLETSFVGDHPFPYLHMTGDIPAGEIREVTFHVEVGEDVPAHEELVTVITTVGTEIPNDFPEQCETTDPTCTETALGRPIVSWEKSVEPASGTAVAPDDVVNYQITIANSGNHAGTFALTDWLDDVLDDATFVEGSLEVSGEGTPEVTFDEDNSQILLSGTVDHRPSADTLTVRYQVRVDEPDQWESEPVLRNVLTPTGQDNPAEICAEQDPGCTENPVRDARIVTSLAADPATGSPVAPGDEVTYTMRLQNMGNAAGQIALTGHLGEVLDDADWVNGPVVDADLSDLVVSRSGASLSVVGDLPPQTDAQISYTVRVKDLTSLDADHDGVLRHAVTPADQEAPQQCQEGSTSCVEHEVHAPAITLTKTAEVTQELAEGDVVRYHFVATNTGNMALNDVTILDDLEQFTGVGDLSALYCPSEELTEIAPGKSVECTATYEVQRGDVDAGVIYNQAVARGYTASGAVVEDFDDATITTQRADTPPIQGPDPADPPEPDPVDPTEPSPDPDPVDPTEPSPEPDPVDPTEPSPEPDPVDPTEPSPGLPSQDVRPETPESSSPEHNLGPSSPGLHLSVLADRSAGVEAGELVTYRLVVTNTGDLPLSSVAIDDVDVSGSGRLGDLECAQQSTLTSQQSLECTTTYEVQQRDIDLTSAITMVASASATAPDASRIHAVGRHDVLPSPAAPGLGLVMEAVWEGQPAPAPAGSVVNYVLTATNTGNVTLTRMSITEADFSGVGELPALECVPATLMPGDSLQCSTDYVVQEGDLGSSSLTNVATAVGYPREGDPVRVQDDTEVPVLPGEPGLTLTKSVTWPSMPHPAAVGERVTYTFVATNTGSLTLTDIDIVDSDFTGSGPLSPIVTEAGTAAQLAPGESITYVATYVVQAEDLASAQLEITSSNSAIPPLGERWPTLPEDPLAARHSQYGAAMRGMPGDLGPHLH